MDNAAPQPFFSLRTAVPTDAEAMVAIHVGRAAVDQVDPYSSLENIYTPAQLRDSLKRAQVKDALDHWLVAQVGSHVAGYSKLTTWYEKDGTWVYLIQGWVIPQWRGQGIGSAMLKHMENLSRSLAAAEHPGEKAELAANASSTELEATRLLLGAGYRTGYTVLELELDPAAPVAESQLPAGVETRPAQPEGLHQVACQIAECVGRCYQDEYDQGRYADEFDVDWFTQRLMEPKQDPTLWQVAWVDHHVVGQVLSIIEENRAEVFEVSVLPAFRRQGIARALLTRALVVLRQRGEDRIRLHTVAEFKTRARDLYHSVGFRVLKEFPRYRKAMG